MTQSNSQVKILWLNTWANRCKKDLLEYVEENVDKKVDVLFFTEVTSMKWRRDKVSTARVGHSENEPPMQLNSASQLIEVLKNDYFCSYVSPKTSEFQCFDSGITFQQVGFGSMMAIRDSLGKNTCGSTLIKNDGDLVKPRAMQWVVFDKSGVRYLAAHLHGVWLKENTKGDDPIRMRQSEQVLKVISGLVIKHKVSKVIFGGDLNLAPDTEALKMLLSGTKAENLSRNLISEYKIRSTRTPLYRKYNDEGTELLADYVLTSSNVEVESLKVGSDVPVSDHMPLLLKFY